MEDLSIPYDLALELKELGFDEPCMKGYTEEYKTLISFSSTHTNTSVEKTLPTKPLTAPLWQQAFKWFRTKYGFDSYIRPASVDDEMMYVFMISKSFDEVFPTSRQESKYSKTYEEAELECLKQLIKIVKKYEK